MATLPAAATTRICVKGLPKNVDDARLRAHFAARFGDASITDARVVKTREGWSRCFGFVGFKTEKEAASAVAWFHRSYFGAARLVVEPAEPVGSTGLARPWSKYTKAKEEGGGGGEGGAPPRERSAPAGARGPSQPDDPRFHEFVALHKRRADVPLWANDDAGVQAAGASKRRAPSADDGRPAATAPDAADADADAASDDDLYEDMTGAADARGVASEGDDDDDGTPPPPDASLADAAVSDADYLKSRTVAAFSSDDEGEEEEEATDDGEPSASDDDAAPPALAAEAVTTPAAAPSSRPSPDAGPLIVDATNVTALGGGGGGGGRGAGAPEDAPATDRLFLRNLPYTASEADVDAALEPHGVVRSVRMVLDRVSRQSRGLAIVTMESVEAAAAARAALDGSIFQGRLLHVLPGEPAPADRGEAGGDATGTPSTSFKAARDAARRAGAGGDADRAAWSSLFIRADTIAAAAAAHFGVAKADLLSPDADDAALRLALGEAHVLATTKAALAAEGVDVGALTAAAAAPRKRGRAPDATPRGPPRSATTLLIKNLPYATTRDELVGLLAPHGALARCVLPPTRALALAEFCDPSAARARLSKPWPTAACTRCPCTWSGPPPTWWAVEAPAGGVSVAGGAAGGATAPTSAPRSNAVASVAARAGDDDDDDAAGTSLFVKNLSFATDDAELAAHFRSVAASAGLPPSSVRAARVARRPRPPGAPPNAPPPSSGYGFVEAASEDAASALARAAGGTRLGGHALVVARAAQRTNSAAAPPGAAATGDTRTKLIVRNVAFQATRADVVGLFSPFGAIKSARLPKKASLDGAHRGYAFIDFASHEEAVAASSGVAGAHLYGRRLAVEWADDDGDGGVDALTTKAAAGFKRQRR